MYEKELARLDELYAENRLLTEMTLKMLKVVQGQIIVSNEEIEELIKFFQEMEKYNICARLKKLIK